MDHMKPQRMKDSAKWCQFTLGIVNISDIQSQKISSLMRFTLTGNPWFYNLEVPLSNTLMIGFFIFKVCHVFADFFGFKQKIYCLFLRTSQNWSCFVVVINLWFLNDLKLQPIQLLETVVFSSTWSHKPDVFWLHRKQSPASLPSPQWWPNQSSR